MTPHQITLAACPFCGGAAELRERGNWFGVGCERMHALMFRTAAEAIAAWNRRTPATTGWPPSELMQDDCKGLSRALASKPDARLHAREAGDAIERERQDRRPLGCALAMRVMQSDLREHLDDAERADCDELVRRNLEWFKRDAAPSAIEREREAPSLPQTLLDLIGEYGMARTDGVSDIERQHRWELLVEGIKQYTAAVRSTPSPSLRTLSDFIRNATPEEKAQVYGEVMDRAGEQQAAVISGAAHSPSLRIAAGEVGERSPKDYAIEHGGYLANSACYLLDCLNELDAARLTHEERDDDASRDDLECAGETAIGARTGLRNAIYEFEKRRDRAALARTPGGEQR
jgi:hypothetical protein